jgi:hypothetical protein
VSSVIVLMVLVGSIAAACVGVICWLCPEEENPGGDDPGFWV